MPGDTTRQPHTIRPHCLSVRPARRVFSSGEAKLGLRLGHGKRLATMQTRYIISTFHKSFLLTYHHQLIVLDPLSPWGYEMKHAALHKGRDYENAVIAFEMMLSMMTESPDLHIQCELYPCSHNQLDLFICLDSARRQIHQFIEHTSND